MFGKEYVAATSLPVGIRGFMKLVWSSTVAHINLIPHPQKLLKRYVRTSTPDMTLFQFRAKIMKNTVWFGLSFRY